MFDSVIGGIPNSLHRGPRSTHFDLKWVKPVEAELQFLTARLSFSV